MVAGQRLVAWAQRKVIEDFAASRGVEVLGSPRSRVGARRTGRNWLRRCTCRSHGRNAGDSQTRPAQPQCRFPPRAAGSGVQFVAVDPEANSLTVGIMALIAQAEWEAISRRTMEAGGREGAWSEAGES
jgi:hypothetical protein